MVARCESAFNTSERLTFREHTKLFWKNQRINHLLRLYNNILHKINELIKGILKAFQMKRQENVFERINQSGLALCVGAVRKWHSNLINEKLSQSTKRLGEKIMSGYHEDLRNLSKGCPQVDELHKYSTSPE